MWCRGSLSESALMIVAVNVVTVREGKVSIQNNHLLRKHPRWTPCEIITLEITTDQKTYICLLHNYMYVVLKMYAGLSRHVLDF